MSHWEKSLSGTPSPLDLKKQQNLSHKSSKMSKCFISDFFHIFVVKVAPAHKMRHHTRETIIYLRGKSRTEGFPKLKRTILLYLQESMWSKDLFIGMLYPGYKKHTKNLRKTVSNICSFSSVCETKKVSWTALSQWDKIWVNAISHRSLTMVHVNIYNQYF